MTLYVIYLHEYRSRLMTQPTVSMHS